MEFFEAEDPEQLGARAERTEEPEQLGATVERFQDPEQLGEMAEHAEADAAQPRRAAHRRVHGGGVTETRKDAPGEHIGNTQSGEQFRRDWHENISEEARQRHHRPSRPIQLRPSKPRDP